MKREDIHQVLNELRDCGVDFSDEIADAVVAELETASVPLEHDPTANAQGGARGSDPGTSKKAARDIYPRSGSQRHKALMAVASKGDTGAIADDVSEITGIEWRSITPRLGELKKHGWVEPRGDTREGRMGAQQEVIVITEKAQKWILKKEPAGAWA